jgi:hypothetical protein
VFEQREGELGSWDYFKTSIRFAMPAMVVLTVAHGLVGCGGKDSSPDIITECVLPGDQSGTLAGAWPRRPVPIALRAGDFSADEASQVTAATEVWNHFYTGSLGMTLFNTGGAVPSAVQATMPPSICSNSLIQANGFVAPVVIFKQSAWTHDPEAVGLTSFCTVGNASPKTMTTAIMELNYQNFFVQGKKQPDLQSILIHEFGHLAGLDHSCDTKGRTGFPNCADPGLPRDYLTAIMYPIVLFGSNGIGEQRRVLQSNDEGRANCLYKR